MEEKISIDRIESEGETMIFYVWLSALQKHIRRGNEEEALFWAFHLVDNGFFGHVISRLRVIGHEDIGTADLNVVPFVAQCLHDMREWYDKKNSAWVLALANAVLALCRANKSRDTDNLQIIVRSRRKKGIKLEIPDYAYDKHTFKGKKLGRGFKHFFEEGANLNPDCSNKIYAEEAKKACIEIEEGKVEDFFTIEYPKKRVKKLDSNLVDNK